MNRVDDPDDGVWLLLYLALTSCILLGVGLLSVAGFSPGGVLTRWWSAVPLVLGGLGLLAAAVGRSLARLFLGGLGALLVIAGLGLTVEFWTLMGRADRTTVGILAMVVAGAACLWLAWGGSSRKPAGGATLGDSPAVPGGHSSQRRRQSRWWLALIATGLPFVLGISAAAAAALGSGPATAGCGLLGERLLQTQASALAEHLPGLALGSLGGCDSGDPAWISWDHDSLPGLVASARAAGCHDAYPHEWDEQDQFMVCGAGPTQLLLSIEIDPDIPGVTGSISLNT